MSLKKLLGLDEIEIDETEIVSKLDKAQQNNLEEVDFQKQDGSVIKIMLPNIGFDPVLFKDR
jgi:hypothetical protein